MIPPADAGQSSSTSAIRDAMHAGALSAAWGATLGCFAAGMMLNNWTEVSVCASAVLIAETIRKSSRASRAPSTGGTTE